MNWWVQHKTSYECRTNHCVPNAVACFSYMKNYHELTVWPGPSQAKDDAFSSTYHAARQRLIPVVHVSIARVLAAKGDLLNVEKTSSARERVSTQCDINKVLIGKVSGVYRGNTALLVIHYQVY